MKKRCKNCKTIVKCDNIEYHKDDGRGIYCDVCGGFISIPKQINGNVRISSSRRYVRGRRLSNRHNMITMYVIALIILVILTTGVFYYFGSDGIWYFEPEEKGYSTFILYDNNTHYDVSDEVEISILISENDVIFDDISDIHNLSNYEMNNNTLKASYMEIDIRHIEYLLVLIDPNNTSVYISEYHSIVGGTNRIFCFYVNIINGFLGFIPTILN